MECMFYNNVDELGSHVNMTMNHDACMSVEF